MAEGEGMSGLGELTNEASSTTATATHARSEGRSQMSIRCKQGWPDNAVMVVRMRGGWSGGWDGRESLSTERRAGGARAGATQASEAIAKAHPSRAPTHTAAGQTAGLNPTSGGRSEVLDDPRLRSSTHPGLRPVSGLRPS